MVISREVTHVSVTLRGDEPDAVIVATAADGATDGDIADVRKVVELASERGVDGQGRHEGGSKGTEDGVEGWQMVTLEEQEVLQQN
jgi:hypothetical protein